MSNPEKACAEYMLLVRRDWTHETDMDEEVKKAFLAGAKFREEQAIRVFLDIIAGKHE